MIECGYYNMDCLDGMGLIEDKTIDMILCDLPYGTTRNAWDSVIPFEKLWKQYERIIKDNGVIALFSAQPFTTDLINSNRKLFRYDLVWDKVLSSGFLNAHKMPLRTHETICIFYKKAPKYNPIMETRGAPREKGRKNDYTADGKTCYGDYKAVSNVNNEYFPTSILTFSNGNRNDGRIHSTQKPVSLCEYLIMTYTDVGDLVLDNCAGSCSTGIAAHKTGRKFIGFEIDKEYFEQSQRRLQQEQAQINLFDIGALL
ncbi:MAG: site-specific DNA-methyltransferase [Roseburia sp.]|nr:site-specific DNA-methyltransferase [Roseburia sp.]